MWKRELTTRHVHVYNLILATMDDNVQHVSTKPLVGFDFHCFSAVLLTLTSYYVVCKGKPLSLG